MVKLPRSKNPQALGESRRMAYRQFKFNQETMRSKGKLDEFNNNLQEYFNLDHAEIIPESQISKPVHERYYLPIHGVIKESSTTTKLLPVCDASAKTSTNVSLNDTLLAGPNMYPKLCDILLKFRCNPIGMSADIKKMFREILLHPDERDFHRFLIEQDKRIVECRMKRLTFGIKSSPFIASRVLQHIAQSHMESHPKAAQAIMQLFYVDDFLTSVYSAKEAIDLKNEICHLLAASGMILRKWRSNCKPLLDTISTDDKENADLVLPSPSRSGKALGTHWVADKDELHVTTPKPEIGQVTKRHIASITAKVYDVRTRIICTSNSPAKILLQILWKDNTNWDQDIEGELAQQWDTWVQELPLITEHPIPRSLRDANKEVYTEQLHGFSDASEVAYGVVIYLQTTYKDTTCSTRIVYAKARVNPIKSQTIPKMELTAAHLLTKAITQVANIYQITTDKIYLWTDSAVVLHWLRKDSDTLKPFVSNRVKSIIQVVKVSQWRHIRTAENPADAYHRN